MCGYWERKTSPHGRCVAYQSKLSLWLMARQELVEVSVLHVLRDHTERVAADAHSQQPNDVGVLQTRHDLYLFQEIAPAWSENVTQHSVKLIFLVHTYFQL